MQSSGFVTTPKRRVSTVMGVLLLAAMLASLVVATALPARAAGAPTLLGFATGGDRYGDLDRFIADAGRGPSLYNLFVDRTKDFSTLAANLDLLEKRGMLAVIEWETSDLERMMSGGEDADIQRLIDGLDFWLRSKPGRGVVIVPLPEANLIDHPWGNNPEAFKAAYRRMRNLFVAAGFGADRVRFGWIMNGVPSNTWHLYYPGDAEVDIIGYNRLNRGDPWRDYNDMFTTYLAEMKRQISTTKPIFIGQTASVTNGGDRGAWLDDMFAGLLADEQIIGAAWFNRKKEEAGTVVDYRVVDADTNMGLDAAFKRGVLSWSAPSAHDWLFDGSLDAWVRARGGKPSNMPTTTSTPESVSCDAPDDTLPHLVGLATSGPELEGEIAAIESATGSPPAFAHQPIAIEGGWPKKWILQRWDAVDASGTTMFFELTTNDLRALASGGRDAELAGVLDSIATWVNADPARSIVVNPLPTPNVTGVAWHSDPAAYRTAFRRIRAAFHDRIDHDRIAWVFSAAGDSSNGLEATDYYPGDGAVDLLGMANRNTGSPWRGWTDLLASPISDLRRTVNAEKPVLITNTGSATTGGDRGAWFTEIFGCVDSSRRVVGAVFLNVATGGVDYQFATSSSVDPAFTAGAKTWSPASKANWLFDGGLDSYVVAEGGKPTARFHDSHLSPLIDDIHWLVEAGITKGCRYVDAYCPNDAVLRGQMMSFLDRALSFPSSNTDLYNDDEGGTHEQSTNDATAAGVTHACSPAKFCPNDPLQREIMALLLDQALDLPQTTKDWFTDDDGSPFEGAINRVAEAGITRGCSAGAGKFCPKESVTRAQMAAFLHRALV